MFKNLFLSLTLLSSFAHASTLDMDVTRVRKAQCPGAGFQILLPKIEKKDMISERSLRSNLNIESVTINGIHDLETELTFSAYMSFFKCKEGEKTFTKRKVIPSMDNFALSRANYHKYVFGSFEESKERSLRSFETSDLKEMLIQILQSANSKKTLPIRHVIRLERATSMYLLNYFLDYEKEVSDFSVLTSRGEINFTLADILTPREQKMVAQGKSFNVKLGLTVSRTIPYNVYLEYNADTKKINLYY